MNDLSRVELDAETPVNPYSLLDAVNRSSDTVNTAWLIFIGLMAYLLVTVAGVSHKDLLLNSDISLPILQVRIDLTRFFLFAPIVLVLLHLGLMGQLVLLARKTMEFAYSIRMLETTDHRTHPLRLELDNFFFVQAIAGPERSRIVSAFLHTMSWLTLVILPVALLLYVQMVFLPYHDATITNVHRVAVIADIALLVFIGVFLMRSDVSFFRAFWRTGRNNPGSLFFAAALLAAAGFFSLAVATIPGAHGREDRAVMFASADGALLGLFRRNLNVADLDLVVDKDVTPGEPSINLRGRDLRFAKLDRTDLHQADMTGANLDGATFVGADLRGVWLACGDFDALLLNEDRRVARCASARGANFSKARLAEAKMAGVDLRGARLEETRLDGADLSHGLMPGANFAGARLDRADLAGANLLGANFLLANLQGADLAGAKLQMTDLANALMQGANLSHASLEGAVLRDAELEGASLAMARLVGANMAGARMQGTDMSGTVVWRAAPPSGEASAFADMAQLALRAPEEAELAALKAAVAGLENGPFKVRMTEGLAALLDGADNANWGASAEQQIWQGFAKASETAIAEGYKGRLTDFLTKLMCRARFANAAVATGLARRAVSPGFKGDMPAVYDRLRAADCPASAAMNPRLMRDLATAADAAKGQ